MKRKIITALSLSLLFVIVFSTQISSTANAEMQNKKPLTSPITYFTISGNVRYQFLKFFGFGKKDEPATNVTVTATDNIHHVVYQTQTDSNGNYTISTQQAGDFLVSPMGGKSKTYIPPVVFINATKPGHKMNVDFKGFVF